MTLPTWLKNLPRCPKCGQPAYINEHIQMHITAVVDAHGAVRIRYYVICEQGEQEEDERTLAEVY